ncbi:hypothetical protein K438DRAFT_1809577 [Mycena galopus ATCC 62051]|nr:hypothetical protein K438DRAFT_1809577 [Mycena galopus ATCC 62051]
MNAVNHVNRPLPDSSSSTISGSGSVQSHLSTANSQQRLRATNAYAVLNKESKEASSFSSSPTSPALSHPINLTNALRRVLFSSPDIVQFPDYSSRSWKGLAFKWMALVYCFLSIVFTSTSLYGYLYLRNAVHVFPSNESDVSSAQILTVEQRLSRLSPYFPYLGGSHQSTFEPYIFLPTSPTDGITACIWSKDDGDPTVRSLVSWTAQWTGKHRCTGSDSYLTGPGLISFVMVTTTHPHSVAHQQLLQRLQPLRDHPSLSGLSLHLFHTVNELHPSTYLNLARLFANSRTVMLFPANLSNVLPSNFHNTLSSRIPHSVRKPLLITAAATSAFSIPDLTPVILPRNYPLWCSERAFLATRTSDWDDCTWQLWLEEYGLGHANMTIAINPEEFANGVESSSLVRRFPPVNMRVPTPNPQDPAP